jgi:DNA-binding LacI/PurR family transcriptional regulator
VFGGAKLREGEVVVAITQGDVAARAGVSRPLVSLVMRDSPHVSPQKREAVLKAAAELGYRRNAHAAQLASHRSMNLGIILAELQNPIFPLILTAAEDQAEAAGYGVHIAVGSPDVEVERRAVNRLLGHRVDGIMLAGTRLSSDELQELAGTVPVITISRRVAGIDAVSVDDRAGARLATQHLVAIGHRRIAHIDGGGGPGSRLRRLGYTDVMEEHGLASHLDVVRGNYSEASGVVAGQSLLDRREPPTAVFAANDLMALGFMGVAKARGLGIPDELSVVGFDDTAICAFEYVRLSTVHQPADELGSAGINSLIERIEQPATSVRTRVLPPRLVLRQTTAPLASGR